MEAVGRLAGGIAHDFNNLLSAILSYSEMVMADLPEAHPSREDLEQIRQAGARAAELTQQLLAFSRRQLLQLRPLNLNTVVAGVDRMLRRVIGEDVVLQTILSPDIRPTRGDAGQLEHVLMNLAVNARDAMPAGGTLTITTADLDVDAAGLEAWPELSPGRYVTLAVRDTGAGMTREVQERIFEPFFTTKPVGHGTGLGLSTVYGIVAQSGGQVFVRSAPGTGSMFTICLPAHTADAEPTVASPPPRPVHGGAETVLLVEDELLVRQLTHEILRRSGYQVLEASDGAEALRLLHELSRPHRPAAHGRGDARDERVRAGRARPAAPPGDADSLRQRVLGGGHRPAGAAHREHRAAGQAVHAGRAHRQDPSAPRPRLLRALSSGHTGSGPPRPSVPARGWLPWSLPCQRRSISSPPPPRQRSVVVLLVVLGALAARVAAAAAGAAERERGAEPAAHHHGQHARGRDRVRHGPAAHLRQSRVRAAHRLPRGRPPGPGVPAVRPPRRPARAGGRMGAAGAGRLAPRPGVPGGHPRRPGPLVRQHLGAAARRAGPPGGYLGTEFDITERKLAEEEMRLDTELFQAVIEVQQAVAAAGLDSATVMRVIAERSMALTGVRGRGDRDARGRRAGAGAAARR